MPKPPAASTLLPAPLLWDNLGQRLSAPTKAIPKHFSPAPTVPKRTSKTGSELFIVDNSDEDWKVLRYLHDWCQLSKAIDIATGYFEIGGILALNDEWQKVDGIRILMGDEVSLRTRSAFAEGLKNIERRLDDSLEDEKDKNAFLRGVPAIVAALRQRKIQCRVFKQDKFHAKCYLTHARQEVVGSFGLVGSSNFTLPGLTQNIELNVQITGTPVSVLQEWYEQHWDKAEDVTAEMLKVVERHTKDYPPFEIYVKALQEYCRGHELPVSDWEEGKLPSSSRLYGQLDQYQKDGYANLMKIARNFGGAFLCDGVGLGKTFIGMMVIERLIMQEGKRVALFVPKTARDDVWENNVRKYLPHIGGTGRGVFSNLIIFNHTDLGLDSKSEELARVRDWADAVIIDEAHHFRNLGRKGEQGDKRSRYYHLSDLLDGPKGRKELFLLTATPINNSLHDFRHMAELFTRGNDSFLSTIGVHSLRSHFIALEKQLLAQHPGHAAAPTDLAEAGQLLSSDAVFSQLVVQRSRRYVVESQKLQKGASAVFPTRDKPQVAKYSIRETYGDLLKMVEKAFRKEKPLFVLGIYYPYGYFKGEEQDKDKWVEGRQQQVVSLIRTQFLKRIESSAHAFEQSCNRLLVKLLTWAEANVKTADERRHLDRWKDRNDSLIGLSKKRQLVLWGGEEPDEEEAEEDLVTEEMIAELKPVDRKLFDVERILADTLDDLNQVADFLKELQQFDSQHDQKLITLKNLLETDPVLKKEKVLIFSEFAETARYLKQHLQSAGVQGVEQIDSGTATARGEIIRRFAPYYNGLTSGTLAAAGEEEIRVLISTDVLSEGLNLQDATRLINYDLHWNPVRLMQRIGRVDRRLNPDFEKQLLADHPERKPLRGHVAYWNFLPPDDLETLLGLFQRVSHKTLKISKTLGIEGKQLLTGDDDFDALKDFNEAHEGTISTDESIRLELQRLLDENPGLAERLDDLPGRVFSGKEHPQPGTKAVFFCFRLPRADFSLGRRGSDVPWTEAAGETRWYLYLLDAGRILEDTDPILAAIRTLPATPRRTVIESETLAEVQKKIEKHIHATWLKRMQAPVGVKPILKCWLELN